MIDADAIVTLPTECLEIPERVGRLARYGALRIGHAKADEAAPTLGALRPIERVADPGLGTLGIDGRRDDVEVAEKDERLLKRQALLNEPREPIHPAELVWEFLR